MSKSFQSIIDAIHEKRRTFHSLTSDEYRYLLADCMLDGRLYASPNWNLRYGGVRYAPSDAPSTRPCRILVLQWPGNLGDVCMTAPFFSVLRQKHPRAEISFLSGRTAQAVFSGNTDIDHLLENPLDPYLDRVLSGLPIDRNNLLGDIALLGDFLRRQDYDLLINLQILPMTAALATLAGVKNTTGMILTPDGMPIIRGNRWGAYLFGVSAGLMRSFNLLHRTDIFSLMIDEEKAFQAAPSILIEAGAVQRVQRFLDDAGVADTDILVGLNPMAGTPIRQWPFFPELIPMLIRQTGAKIILFGAKNEEGEVQEILKRSGSPAIMATDFNLQELMAAVSGCDLFISNDTGPMHLACLLKRPVIALFGPTSFREVGPWQNDYRVLQSMHCRDCYKQSCADPGEYCMGRISPEDVAELAGDILRGRSGTLAARVLQKGIHLEFSGNCCDGPFGGTVEDRVGRALLTFTRNGSHDPAPGDGFPDIDPGLMEQYRRLKGLARRGIQCLKHPSPGRIQELDSIHRSLFGAHPAFQPVVAFNDFLFLDKRMAPARDPRSFRRFHESILNDLERMMACLAAQFSGGEDCRPPERNG